MPLNVYLLKLGKDRLRLRKTTRGVDCYETVHNGKAGLFGQTIAETGGSLLLAESEQWTSPDGCYIVAL